MKHARDVTIVLKYSYIVANIAVVKPDKAEKLEMIVIQVIL